MGDFADAVRDCTRARILASSALRELAMGWNPCTQELLARAARAIAHTHELIERGRELQLEGQAHLTISRMAIARSQHLLDRQASNDSVVPRSRHGVHALRG
jgi:hypothetical protein